MNNTKILATALIWFATFSLSISYAYSPEDYKPTQNDFWQEIDTALRDSNYEKVMKLSRDQMSLVKKDSLEYAEAELAMGIALKNRGIIFGATTLFADLLKNKLGTEVASRALIEVEDIVRHQPIDENFVLGELINDLEFDVVTPKMQDFVSYEQGLASLLRGYPQWSDADFKKITRASYWDFKLKYMTALGEVARNRMDSALEKFAGIASDPVATDDIKTQASHQQARLLFEKGDYTQAYKIFRTVKLSAREKGLILLERAWSKYYLKDYSKALGLLAALEAPMFDTSRSPEPYILKMVIYKELCYYDAAFQTLNEFKRRFDNSIKTIRKRRDLRKDQMIVSLSLLDQRYEKWADFLNSLRTERSLMDEYSWSGYSFYAPMKHKYDLKIRETVDRLSWILKDKVRDVANQLLDWQEQLVFLEYQTRLDSLRVIRPQTEDVYKSEDIPHMTFNKIYWHSDGEFWLDELEDYKVIVESRCKGEGSSK